MKKRILSLALACGMAIATVPTITAYANNAINVSINNQQVNFSGQTPVIVDGRTLVPVRDVFEAMGFVVEWDLVFSIATLTRGNTVGITSFPVRRVNSFGGVPARGVGFAVTDDNGLWTWGLNNQHGQVGDGTTIDRHSPVKIMDNIRYASVNFHTTMAITTNGELWAWNVNNSHRPVRIHHYFEAQ